MRASRIRKLLGLSVALTLLASSPSLATPLTLGGGWLMLDDTMSAGDYFIGASATYGSPPVTFPAPNGTSVFDNATRWTWSSLESVLFSITDWSAATDRFNVYDTLDPGFNPIVPVPIAVFNGGTPWQNIPGCDPNGNGFLPGCHSTLNPDVAFADPVFASGTYLFGPGAHSIVIQNTLIPYNNRNHTTTLTDGTVAFRIDPVPEPGSLILLGTGLLAGAARLRQRTRRKS